MKRTLSLVLAAALCAAQGHAASAGRTHAPARHERPSSAASQAETSRGAAGSDASGSGADSPGSLKLDEAGRELVRSSRAAVLSAGFSEAYFDRHFTPFRVVNRAGDRRVVWRFRAGGHEAYVNDSVGFHTDRRGRRVNTHSVASTLAGARDLGRTITRRRAERLMRSCIGEFEGGAVVFQQFGPRPRTALVFTASSVRPPARAAPPAAGHAAPEDEAGADIIRRAGRKGPPVYLSAVDLQTGRCLKGKAQAGAPKPDDAQESRPRKD